MHSGTVDLARSLIAELPLWPPVLATRGPGSRSELHAHHALHLVLSTSGPLRFQRAADDAWAPASGVLTAPDVPHAIDATGVEVLIVFIQPESAVGEGLARISSGVRPLTGAERDELVRDADPLRIMRADGAEWTARAASVLGGDSAPPRRAVHPRVRKLLRVLRESPPGADASLESLAAKVGLSESRLMHAFTESIGVPLRPYLAWLRIQRAAAGIVAGRPLAEVALAAGFADAAHMTRTFKRTFGVTPSKFRRT